MKDLIPFMAGRKQPLRITPMKNSIGSLAALAAFAAPALLEATPLPPAPQAASFSNVSLPLNTTVNFDIDGNSTTDFSVFSYSNGLFVDISTSGSNYVTAATVNFGEVFSGENATQITSLNATSFTTGYYGFSFVSGVTTHAAWVSFDFTGSNALVINGAWETSSGQPITVGAIPEPSTVAAIAGATALLGTLALRRRRLPVAEADIAPTA